MMVYYLITDNCNLQCPHCIRGNTSSCSMDYSAAIKGLHQISDTFSDAVLILSGGEPTLHLRFLDILSEALSLFKTVVINSNGTTSFWKDNKTILKNDKLYIQFSLDGTKEYHDLIRGDGNFDKTIDNISFINDNDKSAWISTVVTTKNKDDVIKLPQILSSFNIEKWHVSPLMPFGKAIFNDMPTTSQWNEFVDEIIKITPFRLGIRKIFDMELLNKLSDRKIKEFANNNRNIDLKNCGCVRSKIYIYPDMNVYGCTCMKNLPLGNMNYQHLSEIVKNDVAKKFLNFTPTNSSCIKCKYLAICNGGCIGMQKKYGRDFRCPIVGDEST